MTVVITSGSILNIGSGAVMQGGSVANAPSYVTYSSTTGVSRYDGVGGTTPLWTNTLTSTGMNLGVDLINQKIFAGSSDGNLRKIDASTGATDWTVDAGDIIDGPRIAVDENGDAYVAFRGSSGALATKKINGADGSTVWSSSTAYSNGNSTIYSQAQGAVYACHADGHNAGLVKYDASTGVEIWKKNSSDVLVSNSGAPAKPYDGVLLPNGNIALATDGWTGSNNRGHLFVLNASTGAQIVKTNMVAPHTGRNIVADSTHVFISTGGAGNYMYAWQHDGTNPVTNTGITGTRPLGYRESKDQAYIRDALNSTVVTMVHDGSSITLGDSIGPATRNGSGWPIIFLD